MQIHLGEYTGLLPANYQNTISGRLITIRSVPDKQDAYYIAWTDDSEYVLDIVVDRTKVRHLSKNEMPTFPEEEYWTIKCKSQDEHYVKHLRHFFDILPPITRPVIAENASHITAFYRPNRKSEHIIWSLGFGSIDQMLAAYNLLRGRYDWLEIQSPRILRVSDAELITTTHIYTLFADNDQIRLTRVSKKPICRLTTHIHITPTFWVKKTDLAALSPHDQIIQFEYEEDAMCTSLDYRERNQYVNDTLSSGILKIKPASLDNDTHYIYPSFPIKYMGTVANYPFADELVGTEFEDKESSVLTPNTHEATDQLLEILISHLMLICDVHTMCSLVDVCKLFSKFVRSNFSNQRYWEMRCGYPIGLLSGMNYGYIFCTDNLRHAECLSDVYLFSDDIRAGVHVSKDILEDQRPDLVTVYKECIDPNYVYFPNNTFTYDYAVENNTPIAAGCFRESLYGRGSAMNTYKKLCDPKTRQAVLCRPDIRNIEYIIMLCLNAGVVSFEELKFNSNFRTGLITALIRRADCTFYKNMNKISYRNILCNDPRIYLRNCRMQRDSANKKAATMRKMYITDPPAGTENALLWRTQM